MIKHDTIRGDSIVKDTFRGGVHPKEKKELSREAALRVFDAKGEMVFPLAQHIGKPAKAVVQKGDAVLVGDKLGEADGFVSANVICSSRARMPARRAMPAPEQKPSALPSLL